MDNINEGAQEALKNIVGRVNNLLDDRDEINADIKEVYAEAKAYGLETKIIRKVVSRDRKRKKSEKEFEDELTLIEVYEEGLNE